MPTILGSFIIILRTYKWYKFEAHQVSNVDETGLTTVKKPSKILSEKRKTSRKNDVWEKGATVTIEVAVNAIGNFVPPLHISQSRFYALPHQSRTNRLHWRYSSKFPCIINCIRFLQAKWHCPSLIPISYVAASVDIRFKRLWPL